MSWRATLDSTQVKQFKTALNCFNKIGSELLIEAVPSKLILRSLNSSRSAFVAITFHSNFFDAHNIFDSRDVKGSVLIKHALALFRTQRIQKLVLELDVKTKQQLVATVTSESGLQKEYCIPCIDSEILQATVDRNSLPTHVIASAKELHRLLSSFQANLEEITVIALPETMHDGQSANAVQLHSYVDPSRRQADAALHTEISVNTDALFSSFQHTAEEAADVTFNLRDFRVMLAWCMTMDMDMAIRFQSPGAPLLAEPHCGHGEMDVEAQLVLATLLESQAHLANPRKSNPAGNTGIKTYFKTPGMGPTPHVPGDTPANSGRQSGAQQTARPGANTRNARSRFAPENQRQPHFETPAPQAINEPQNVGTRPGQTGTNHVHTEPEASLNHDDNMEQNVDVQRDPDSLAKQPSNKKKVFFGSLQNSLHDNQSFEDDDQEDNGPSPLRSRFDPRAMADDDEEDDEEDAIPGTP